jgi:uncharacterized integral membrane protein
MARRRDKRSPDDWSSSSTPGSDASGWRSLEEPKSNRARRQLIMLGVIGVIVLLFILLNRARVETSFIFFTVTTPKWVGFVVSLALGAIAGWFLHIRYSKRGGR